MKKNKEKLDLNNKVDAEYIKLVHGAQNEMIRHFEMRRLSYNISDIVELASPDVAPCIIKLNKKYPGSKVLNVGNVPVIYIKLKDLK